MRIKVEVELRRPSRHVAAALLGILLLALPGVVLAGDQFPDVPSGHPFHDDINWLADNDIANGFSDGTYRPGEAVTRQAMAAFMHRLSNEFEVVNESTNPAAATAFFASATCPADKRAIAGGGFTNAANMFINDSFPSANTWWVDWESDDNATVDPSTITVWALCAPAE